MIEKCGLLVAAFVLDGIAQAEEGRCLRDVNCGCSRDTIGRNGVFGGFGDMCTALCIMIIFPIKFATGSYRQPNAKEWGAVISPEFTLGLRKAGDT